MKTCNLFLPFLVSLAAGCSCPLDTPIEDTSVPIREIVKEYEVSQCAISNELLQVTTLPGAMGGIENIKLLKNSRSLLWGARFQRILYGELIEQPVIQGNVFIELFWNMRNLSCGTYPVEVVKALPHELEFYAEHYGSVPLSLRRKISLEAGTAAVNIEVTVTNRADTVQKLRPWIDIVPRSGDVQRVLPVLGNVSLTAIGGGEKMPRTGLYNPSGELHNFLAPARSWIAVRLEEEDVIMVIQPEAQDLKQCAIYFWNGRLEFKPAHTLEFILNETSLSVGQSHTYRYRIGVFSGLKYLRDCVGDIGVDLSVNGPELMLSLGTLRPIESQDIKVEITSKNGHKSVLPSQMTGKLTPGNVTKLKFQLPGDVKPEESSFSVSIGKDKIELLEQVAKLQ